MVVVSDLMTSTVFTLHRIDTLHDVRALMDLTRVRHIPVVDEQSVFQGIITQRDLLGLTVSKLAGIEQAEQTELEASIMVGDIMCTDVVTVSPGTHLKEAASILYKNKYGCLPVLVDDKLVGIITESDFLRLAIALLGE